jgi:hypothetical protein
MKMEAGSSSNTSVPLYYTGWCHIPEEDLHTQRCEFISAEEIKH